MSLSSVPASVATRVRHLSPLPGLVATVGGLVVLIAVTQAALTLRSGGSLLVALVDAVFVGGPGGAILYAGFWLPESDIDRESYPRIIAWLLGGVVVMYGFIVLRDLHPGVTVEWSLGTQAIALMIGSIGGLLIGVQETRAAVRAKQLERRTAELEARTSALERRETELERQNEQLDEFAGIVSHDLRNPLNVARGRLELVAEDCESEHLSHVVEAHDRMEELIDDLLLLARGADSVSAVEPVSLSTLAEACWDSAGAHDATLVVDADRTVAAERTRLQQLVENLLRNSVEHAGDDVTVTVGDLDYRDGFFVADDGPGVPEADRETVFERGYSTAAEGTGFGLSIVAQVADTHGWDVRATESENGGARFEITGVEPV